MPEDRPEDRTVTLGKKEWEAAGRLSHMLGQKPDAKLGARIGVTIAAALDNARRVGFAIRLMGADGRRYEYELSDPKHAHELNGAGGRTGKRISLIDLVPAPVPPQRPKLRRVK